MGRKKSYDRDVLVGKAMELFRDHGFAGTSAEMLVEGLGVNRYSLYAEFGSKQALFNAALQRYDEEVLDSRRSVPNRQRSRGDAICPRQGSFGLGDAALVFRVRFAASANRFVSSSRFGRKHVTLLGSTRAQERLAGLAAEQGLEIAEERQR